MSSATLTIADRFCGPAGSGNGGYTAGRLAGHLHGPLPISVTLRKPPPLDTPLRVETGPGTARLVLGDDLVAEAMHESFTCVPPLGMPLDLARDAESSFAGLLHHPFPRCFVCGTDRSAGDALVLSPGSSGAGHTACVWTPDASLSGGDDATVASPEFVWSALDCPGGWTSDLSSRPLVLGRITATHARLPRIGQPYVVVGALRGSEGRKTFTASALYEPGGALVARAEHTWIEVDPSRF